jgi:hypothetical protein
MDDAATSITSVSVCARPNTDVSPVVRYLLLGWKPKDIVEKTGVPIGTVGG